MKKLLLILLLLGCDIQNYEVGTCFTDSDNQGIPLQYVTVYKIVVKGVESSVVRIYYPNNEDNNTHIFSNDAVLFTGNIVVECPK